MRALLGVMALSSSLLSAGCTVECTPTTTTADDANKVDLVTPGGSAVLRATVRAEGAGLPGLRVHFDVQADGDSVYGDDATTGDSGRASLDLKRVDVGSLSGLARGNGFIASFEGSSTYCASSDGASFRIVRAPAGVSVG